MSGCRAATERLQGRCLGKGFLLVGEASARLEALSALIEAARGNCTPAKDDELVVPLRMGDMLPESAEDVVRCLGLGRCLALGLTLTPTLYPTPLYPMPYTLHPNPNQVRSVKRALASAPSKSVRTLLLDPKTLTPTPTLKP